jgi:ABC-type Fe3+/spermidine/putrescine transport system ATPase subunit
MSLRVEQITKTFGETLALGDVSFDVAEGEIVAVLGPSGCGKSTLLAVIAGLETPERGEVFWSDEPLRGVAPHLRGFGLMFQDYALFPHMNVYDNVAFGLRMLGMTSEEVDARIADALDLVGLHGFEKRDISTLSGGEQQRVALARSLAPRPKLLMLDEPLGSLDRTLRERLLLDLRGILRQLDQTAIYVTHDQEEAFAIADRVVLMNRGAIVQIGTPQAVHAHPASPFVARFLGLENLLQGTAIPKEGLTHIETALGAFTTIDRHEGDVTVLLRPNAARLDSSGNFHLKARLMERSFRGTLCRAVFAVGDVQLTFEFLSGVDLPEIGQTIELSFVPETAIQVLQ